MSMSGRAKIQFYLPFCLKLLLESLGLECHFPEKHLKVAILYLSLDIFFFLKESQESGKIVLQLRALAAFVESLGASPSSEP